MCGHGDDIMILMNGPGVNTDTGVGVSQDMKSMQGPVSQFELHALISMMKS